MKKILYIFIALVFIAVSCKKQDVLQKSQDDYFVKKGTIVETEDEDDSGTKDPSIVETEDEDDGGKTKKGPKGTSSK